MLEEADGLKILERLKADDSTMNMSVVLITSISQQTTVVKGIKLGAQGYLKKPFHPKDLIDRVSKFF